jgi:hypothetical protein
MIPVAVCPDRSAVSVVGIIELRRRGACPLAQVALIVPAAYPPSYCTNLRTAPVSGGRRGRDCGERAQMSGTRQSCARSSYDRRSSSTPRPTREVAFGRTSFVHAVARARGYLPHSLSTRLLDATAVMPNRSRTSRANSAPWFLVLSVTTSCALVALIYSSVP